MTTAAQIFRRAAIAIGTLDRSETLSALEANDALATMNALLDSWSNENLMCYRVLEGSHTLTIGTASYTIGSGGDINTTRPLEIVQAYIRDGSGNNYNLRIVPRDKWNQIGNRSSNITSQIPNTLFYDPQFALGVINLFPTPSSAFTLFYNALLQLTTFTALTDSLTMPPGYERAYILNLALELPLAGFPMLLNEQARQNLVEMAAQAKANVKRTNIREVIANYSPELVARSYATYNPYTDSFGRFAS